MYYPRIPGALITCTTSHHLLFKEFLRDSQPSPSLRSIFWIGGLSFLITTNDLQSLAACFNIRLYSPEIDIRAKGQFAQLSIEIQFTQSLYPAMSPIEAI